MTGIFSEAIRNAIDVKHADDMDYVYICQKMEVAEIIPDIHNSFKIHIFHREKIQNKLFHISSLKYVTLLSYNTL